DVAQSAREIMRKSLSACLIMKDEAANLTDCLQSIEGQVDEIIVVDTGSTDDTIDLAKRFGAIVERFCWTGDFAVARNFSLSLATSDFVLVIDADERAPKDLRAKFDVQTAICDAFIGRVRIRSSHRDQLMQSRVSISQVTRLLVRRPEVYFYGPIHEQVADASNALPRLSLDIELAHSGYDLAPWQMAAKSARNLQLLDAALGRADTREEYRAYLQYQLGKTLFALEDWHEARTALAKSLQEAPKHASYRPELLMTYLHTLKRLELQDEIWPVLLQSLQDYPDLPDLHFFMAGAYIHFGIADLSTIERCYRTCIAIGEQTQKYPTVEGVGSYLALYNLGLLYQQSGLHEEAQALFAEAIRRGYPAHASP
ncbi:MAG: glycosyltransferase, partial [Firmicutes bacterium]|nr:glycosyltransferase [Bacillota bacterium]